MVKRMKWANGIWLAILLTGCVVGPPGPPGVEVETPGIWVGGAWDYGHPHDVHAWSHRGDYSRHWHR